MSWPWLNAVMGPASIPFTQWQGEFIPMLSFSSKKKTAAPYSPSFFVFNGLVRGPLQGLTQTLMPLPWQHVTAAMGSSQLPTGKVSFPLLRCCSKKSRRCLLFHFQIRLSMGAGADWLLRLLGSKEEEDDDDDDDEGGRGSR